MTDDSSSRIVADLRAWLATAAPGARLPSTRTLVGRYAASPVTVQKALRTLTAQGLIETRPGAGAFARGVRLARPSDYGWQTAALGAAPPRGPHGSTPLRSAPNDAIALHSGYPDRELLPERLVRAAFVRAARGVAAVSRPPSPGRPELQSWFAAELAAVTAPSGSPPAPGDVVVFPGSQSALNTVFRSLVGAGRPLIVESPTYWGALLAAAQSGVRVVPVPSGPAGPDPDELARALARTGARACYVQPAFANPTGALWPPDVAEAVLDAVRRHGAFLIEDDWASDFGIDDEPVPLASRDDGGHVVYLRSLTKSVSPSVRIAGVIARGPARERILCDARAEAIYVSDLLQAAALDVVTHPGWATHRRALRHQLRARRDLLVDAVRRAGPALQLELVPRGGLNLWVRLPDGTDLVRVSDDCERAGVLVATGDEWFPAEPTGAYLRLNVSGPNPGAFPEGVRVVADAVAAQWG